MKFSLIAKYAIDTTRTTDANIHTKLKNALLEHGFTDGNSRYDMPATTLQFKIEDETIQNSVSAIARCKRIFEAISTDVANEHGTIYFNTLLIAVISSGSIQEDFNLPRT